MGVLYENIQKMCDEQNITGYRLCKEIGIQPSLITDLKKGRKKSLSADTLSKIAAFFKVSVDYLRGKSAFRNPHQLIDHWSIGDVDFDPNFDFGKIVHEERERQGVTVDEMAQALAITPEDVSHCESGDLPISRKLADQMAAFLGTDVPQLLFDYNHYPDEVPYEYHDNVSAWEKMREKLDAEAKREDAILFPEPSASPTEQRLKLLARHLDKIPEEQRERLIKNFEDTIDLYFDAMGIPKGDK